MTIAKSVANLSRQPSATREIRSRASPSSPDVGLPLSARARALAPPPNVGRDNGAAETALVSGGVTEPSSQQSCGPNFGQSDRLSSFVQQADHRVLQLFVLLAEDQISQPLTDRGFGCLDLRSALLRRLAVSHNPQHDGRLVHGDSNLGIAAAGGEIAQHFFRLRFTDPEAVDPRPLNDAISSGQSGHDLFVEHALHLVRDAGKRGDETFCS